MKYHSLFLLIIIQYFSIKGALLSFGPKENFADIGNHAFPHPVATDWDNDGLIDLLVGVLKEGTNDIGTIIFLKNISSNINPQYDSPTFLYSDGAEISLSGGSWCGAVTNLQVEDLNGDGLNDIICGEKDGYVNFFSNNGDGSLHFEGHIQANGIDIISMANNSPISSLPTIADMNGDGLLDLILGGNYTLGTINLHLYLNIGTKNMPRFSEFSVLEAADTAISYGYLAARIIDLDGDSKKDLVLGAGEYVFGVGQCISYQYYPNIGTNESPKYTSPLYLGISYEKISKSYGFDISDIDGDGRLDIITGCLNTPLHFYKGKNTGQVNKLYSDIVQLNENISIHSSFIRINNFNNSTISIYKLNGSCIYKKSFSEPIINIPMSNYSNGHYIIQKVDSKSKSTIKIIIPNL